MLSIIPCTYLIFKCHLWSIITVKSSSHLKIGVVLIWLTFDSYSHVLNCPFTIILDLLILLVDPLVGLLLHFSLKVFLFDKGVADSDFLWFSCVHEVPFATSLLWAYVCPLSWSERLVGSIELALVFIICFVFVI